MRTIKAMSLFACLCALTLVAAPSVTWSQAHTTAPSTAQTSRTEAEAHNDTSHSFPDEHWNVLSARSSDLRPASPVVGEVDKLPEYTREMVRLEWRQHDPVDVYVIRPKGIENPPVVVYLYGFPTDIDKFRNDTFCKYATQHGFAAVGFVSALTGLRYHDRPMKEWFVSELQETLAKSTHDVQMVLDYLATRNDLDMSRVGMYGQGSGGTIAILSAVADPRIKSIDVMDPWGDWSDWLAKSPQITENERIDYLQPSFLAKVAGLDPVIWLPLLKDRPVRVQENTFSGTNPEAARKHIEAALPSNATLVEYKDRDEYIKNVSTNGNMLDWLRTQLQPSTSTAPHFSMTSNEAATAKPQPHEQP